MNPPSFSTLLIRKIAVALTPRRFYLKTRLSNGAVVYGKNRAGFGGRGIFIFRDALEPELYHLEKFLNPTGVFVDIGANTGVYTTKAARHFENTGTVVSIEPFPDVFATLCMNIQINRFTNVRLRNICIGSTTRSAQLWKNFNKPNSFSLIRRDEEAPSLSVLEVSLDDLSSWEGLNRLDYLKIDAEGAEKGIFSGAQGTIRKFRPIVQVESINEHELIVLPQYSIFQAPGSPNRLYIPNEHPKIDIPRHLHWVQLNN